MALNFKNPGVSALSPLGFAAYPVQASLKDRFILGGDEASTVTNQVADRGDATMAGGSITYEDGYVTFGGAVTTNRMTMATNESEFTNVTRIAVVRHQDAIASSNDWRQAIGYYNGVGNGLALFSNVATMANGALDVSAIGIAAPPHDDFHFIAMTYDNAAKKTATFYGRGGKIYAGGTHTDASAASRVASPMLIGGQALLGANAPVLDIATASQHNAVLSAADMLAIYTYERDWLLRDHGITVA